MHLLFTRQEIRRQVRNMLGQQATEGTAAGDLEQLNSFINASAIKAHQDCRTKLTERRATVPLGMEQFKIAYPDDCALGGVVEMAVWDTDHYVPVHRRTLNLPLDFDKLVTEGGDAFRAIQGRPEFFDQRADGIYLWRPNDQTARDLRMRYHLRQIFLDDHQVCTVDGMAIIYWTLGMKKESMGDTDGKADARALYADRISDLRAWANTGAAMDLDPSASFSDIMDPRRPTPNWDTRPTVR